MDEQRYKKFYVDWWNIRNSTVYGLLAIVLFAGLIGGGLWYGSKNNWFQVTNDGETPKDAAKIISFEGEVRITRASTRETILVTRETYVAAGDTVQTQADGRAVIQMIDGSVYSVRPNSTVVVRDTTSLFGGKNVRVRVDGGQLNVRTDEQGADVKNIVELGDSENQVGPKTDASFNADGTTGGEIRVSRGGIETTIAGETTALTENTYAVVGGGKLSAREKLMQPPRPVTPANSEQIVDGGDGVTASLTWQDPDENPAINFYLQVAKVPGFLSDSILVDRSGLASRDFRLTGLSPGTYYWRLKATGRSGQVTNWSDAWKFTVVRGTTATDIDATGWKVEPLGGTVYVISGQTQPGRVIRAVGRDTFAAADGSFKMQISSASTEIDVEVGDGRGSRAVFIISLRSGTLLRRR
ncbi:MAG TPA: FecR domain-containing protein [Pyrinomonadaceae bacterium]|nr:FecR domain-containing protein [Pyrinomonadaceae bacterium]